MFKIDSQLNKYQSQKSIDTNRFKIRLPIHKKLTNYQSWRKLNNTDKIISIQDKDIFIKIAKAVNGNNLENRDFTNQTKQQNNDQDKQKKCMLIVSTKRKKNSKIYYKVTTVNALRDFLSSDNKQIICYCTIGKDILLDYYLTLDEMNIQYINGSIVHLEPIYRIQQGYITINSFDIVQCIGTGGFSKVYLCRFLQDGKFYAMKVINKEYIVSNKKKKIVINQRNIMIQLNHPFIIKIKFAFQSEKSLIFVLEHCPGGQLFNLVKKYRRMKQDMVRFYIIEILLGLEYIHNNHIVYRDFKPQNILLDIDGHIRIADFGLAKPDINSIKDRATSFCGSPQYMPPQMILKNGHSFPVDFYCIGALIYQLITGLPPFYNKDPNKIYQSTISQEIVFPNNLKISNELKDLLYGLLQKDQKYRIGSLSGSKQVLSHPWFGKINRQQYLNKRVSPPIKFTQFGSITFKFDDIKQNQQQLIEVIKIQQQRQKQNIYHNKILVNFYYDYRNPQGNNLLTIQNLISTRRKKINTGLKQVLNQSTRSHTSKYKMRKNPYSIDIRTNKNNNNNIQLF